MNNIDAKSHDYQKIQSEVFALQRLKKYWPGYHEGYVKGESPDWHNDVESVGLEITRAYLPIDGKNLGISTKLHGKSLYQAIAENNNVLRKNDNISILFALNDNCNLISYETGENGNKTIYLNEYESGNKIELSSNDELLKECVFITSFGGLMNSNSWELASYKIIKKKIEKLSGWKNKFKKNVLYVMVPSNFVDNYDVMCKKVMKINGNDGYDEIILDFNDTFLFIAKEDYRIHSILPSS